MSFESTIPLPTSSTPYSYPLPFPDPQSSPSPPKPPLTPDQQSSLKNLISHFNAPNFELPNNLKAWRAFKEKEKGGKGGIWGSWKGVTVLNEEEAKTYPLSAIEKCYWSREAFLRCLRSKKWDYEGALRRAEETVVWRREYDVENLGADKVSKEGETGKELVCGYDIYKRPVLYMHPYRQNTATGPSQIDFVVWTLERCLDLCPPTDPPTEMLCLVIDFGASQSGGGKGQPTSLPQAKRVLDILQNYYYERLGRAICVDVPSLFYTFYKMVGPFVDPVTKDKIRFLEKPDATELIPKSQLQALAGGDIDFQYDHDTFFPALTKLAAERKAANLERWKKYGGDQCGLSESVIRGAVVPEEGKSDSTTSTVVGNGETVVEKREAEPEAEFEDAPLASEKAVEKAVEGISEGVKEMAVVA